MIEPGIRQDNTWLVIDPIVGCKNNCQYCFMCVYNKAICEPRIAFSPEEAIRQLYEYWAFGKWSYLLVGSATDMFLTQESIDYLRDFISLYSKKGLKNCLCISTKCYIPDDFIDFVNTKSDLNIVFYISYSGLPRTIEPNIDQTVLLSNFTRLSQAGHKPIHLFRPLIPHNSTIESFFDVIGNVAEHAACSVVRGLNLNSELQKMIWFWNEAKNGEYDFDKTVSLFPGGWYERLCKAKERFPDYPMFLTNACALSYKCSAPDFVGTFGSKRCKRCWCPSGQRDRCEQAHEPPDDRDLTALGSIMEEWGLKNDITLNEDEQEILVSGELSHEQVVCATQRIGKRINVERVISLHEWGGYILNHEDLEI